MDIPTPLVFNLCLSVYPSVSVSVSVSGSVSLSLSLRDGVRFWFKEFFFFFLRGLAFGFQLFGGAW